MSEKSNFLRKKDTKQTVSTVLGTPENQAQIRLLSGQSNTDRTAESNRAAESEAERNRARGSNPSNNPSASNEFSNYLTGSYIQNQKPFQSRYGTMESSLENTKNLLEQNYITARQTLGQQRDSANEAAEIGYQKLLKYLPEYYQSMGLYGSGASETALLDTAARQRSTKGQILANYNAGINEAKGQRDEGVLNAEENFNQKLAALYSDAQAQESADIAGIKSDMDTFTGSSDEFQAAYGIYADDPVLGGTYKNNRGRIAQEEADETETTQQGNYDSAVGQLDGFTSAEDVDGWMNSILDKCYVPDENGRRTDELTGYMTKEQIDYLTQECTNRKNDIVIDSMEGFSGTLKEFEEQFAAYKDDPTFSAVYNSMCDKIEAMEAGDKEAEQDANYSNIQAMFEYIATYCSVDVLEQYYKSIEQSMQAEGYLTDEQWNAVTTMYEGTKKSLGKTQEQEEENEHTTISEKMYNDSVTLTAEAFKNKYGKYENDPDLGDTYRSYYDALSLVEQIANIPKGSASYEAIGNNKNVEVTVSGNTYKVQFAGEEKNTDVLTFAAGIEDGTVFAYDYNAYYKVDDKVYLLEKRSTQNADQINALVRALDWNQGSGTSQGTDQGAQTTQGSMDRGILSGDSRSKNEDFKRGDQVEIRIGDRTYSVKFGEIPGGPDVANYAQAKGIKDGDTFYFVNEHGVESVWYKRGDTYVEIAGREVYADPRGLGVGYTNPEDYNDLMKALGKWTSYEDAAQAGYSGIMTVAEWSRRRGDYSSYQEYLTAMYRKYVISG